VAISAIRKRVFWKAPTAWPKARRSGDVRQRLVERRPRRRDAGGGDGEALLRQVGHQVAEALALLTQQVGHRHVHIGEEQLGGVLGVHADLVEVSPPLEPVHAALDHHQ
jgi:hypothetical protein